jgi:hypothetical protein
MAQCLIMQLASGINLLISSLILMSPDLVHSELLQVCIRDMIPQYLNTSIPEL